MSTVKKRNIVGYLLRRLQSIVNFVILDVEQLSNELRSVNADEGSGCYTQEGRRTVDTEKGSS
jgi:hypothetical protein